MVYNGFINKENKENKGGKRIMFKYTDNNDLIKEIKKMIIDNNTTQKEISDRLGVSVQQLHNILKKKNLSFFDVDKICTAAGVELFINFRKKEKKINESKSEDIAE